MHACELVELAAVVSAHGPVLVHGSQQLSATSVQQYWTASKCRLDRWGHSLKQFTTDVFDVRPLRRGSQWPMRRAVLEEILVSEVLTRVFTAVMSAHDRRRGTDMVEPIVRSVMVGHLEARNRVLSLLVDGPGIDAQEATKLNRLRRRSERWIDLLIGYLAGHFGTSQFAVDPERAKDFAEDLHYRSDLKGGQHAWPLVQASLRAGFRRELCPLSPNPDLNARIAASVLSCFRSELFDSTGTFRSLWMLRLANVSKDAQVMLDELLVPEKSLPEMGEKQAAEQMLDRLRRFGTC